MTPADALSTRLRLETRELHARAERTGIMPLLLRGRLERGSYCALLRSLHEIYAALEAALTRHAAHRCIAPLATPSLFRQAALASDLATLHGDRWPFELAPCPAAMRYVARLQAIADTAPERLVAHAYVRYLGDLSGGQALRKPVARMLGIDGIDGMRFYDFGGPQETACLARRFRAGLDAAGADEACADAIVDEAKLAFELHLPLFEELCCSRLR